MRPLSAGGMGAVYVVLQLSTGKERRIYLDGGSRVCQRQARGRNDSFAPQ